MQTYRDIKRIGKYNYSCIYSSFFCSSYFARISIATKNTSEKRRFSCYIYPHCRSFSRSSFFSLVYSSLHTNTLRSRYYFFEIIGVFCTIRTNHQTDD